MILLPALFLSTVFTVADARRVEESPPLVTWQNLCDRPSRWLGKTVRLRVQYQGRVDTWNPYLTRFGSKRFTAIQAWSDEQFPWIKSDFDAPQVRLFLPRGESCSWALDKAQSGSRFEWTAVVREVFLDVPWAEIKEVLPLPERIGEGTVIHASKAVELLKRKEWKLAGLEVEQAITESLPAQARAELERLRGECRDGAAAAQRPGRSKIEVR
jgi:hypothetical protein